MGPDLGVTMLMWWAVWRPPLRGRSWKCCAPVGPGGRTARELLSGTFQSFGRRKTEAEPPVPASEVCAELDGALPLSPEPLGEAPGAADLRCLLGPLASGACSQVLPSPHVTHVCSTGGKCVGSQRHLGPEWGGRRLLAASHGSRRQGKRCACSQAHAWA